MSVTIATAYLHEAAAEDQNLTHEVPDFLNRNLELLVKMGPCFLTDRKVWHLHTLLGGGGEL